jgi:hypothetical protein
VQRVAPQLGQRRARQLEGLVLRRRAASSAWQQGTSTMAWACLARPKAMASSVALSQACSAVTMSMRSGRAASCAESAARC